MVLTLFFKRSPSKKDIIDGYDATDNDTLKSILEKSITRRKMGKQVKFMELYKETAILRRYLNNRKLHKLDLTEEELMLLQLLQVYALLEKQNRELSDYHRKSQSPAILKAIESFTNAQVNLKEQFIYPYLTFKELRDRAICNVSGAFGVILADKLARKERNILKRAAKYFAKKIRAISAAFVKRPPSLETKIKRYARQLERTLFPVTSGK